MKLVFILTFLITEIALCKSINLEVNSTVRLDKVTEKKSSKIRVELNKEFVLPSKNTKILMRVEELKGLSRGPGGERPILVSAEIYHFKNGMKELVSKPHIVTHMGKKTDFSTIDYDGREVTLSITPSTPNQ